MIRMGRFAYHPPILAYHRVGAFHGDHVPTVSPEAFKQQMALVARWRYRVVALSELLAQLDSGESIRRREVVITFDDGYQETAQIAWPILKSLGFPATVFVTPGEVGLSGFATWDEIAAMDRDGVTIGSHTMHHSFLPLVPDARLPEELGESKRVIETHLGHPIEWLSYPIGGYTPQAQAAARQLGYRGACTTNRADRRRQVDRFALRRIKMTERDAHPLLLRAKLSGYYDAFRTLRAPG